MRLRMEPSNGNVFERVVTGNGNTQYFLFSNGFSMLSNYHYSPFFFDGVRFRNVEQFLCAEKALMARDFQAYQNVMDEKSCVRYKDIKITNVNYDKWNAVRFQVLIEGLEAKFRQSRAAMERLKETGDRVIVHAT